MSSLSWGEEKSYIIFIFFPQGQIFITLFHNVVFLKSVLHCNAKPLAFGPRIGLDPQRDDFSH